MDADTLANWLDAYGHAWETKDPEAVTKLFTEDAAYHEKPFDEPSRGREGIAEYWSEIPETQDEIQFSYDILAVSENRCIAHWHSEFVRIRNGKRVELDGVFLLEYDDEGLCTRLREWWHSRDG
jgi:uncharacterized protein (TIGR02246 family)